MEIYILRIKKHCYDQRSQKYDEDLDEEYLLWALNERTAINKMRKWKPCGGFGDHVTVTRDTAFRTRQERVIDYFVEHEDGEEDLFVVELSVEPCVSIEDAETVRAFCFGNEKCPECVSDVAGAESGAESGVKD